MKKHHSPRPWPPLLLAVSAFTACGHPSAYFPEGSPALREGSYMEVVDYQYWYDSYPMADYYFAEKPSNRILELREALRIDNSDGDHYYHSVATGE